MKYPKHLIAAKKMLEMKDLKYGKGVNQQEDRVTEILIESGLIQHESDEFPKNGIRTYLDWVEADCLLLIPEGTFVKAYFGDNQHPDYISRECDRIFWWECKSTQTMADVQFNTHLPSQGIIFVITLTEKTIIAFGEWLITEDEKDKFIPFIEGMAAVAKLAPKDVIGWKARARKFFGMSCLRKLANNGYGDECSASIIKFMEGEKFIAPVKLEDFKSLAKKTTLVAFFK